MVRLERLMPELTKADKLVLVAARLQAEGQKEFSAEQLIVEAYRNFPTDFCLKGYSEYPNSNAVLTFLMGKSARLIVTGWLEKTGRKMYRITAKGVAHAEAVSGHSFSPTAGMEREVEEGLGRLLESAAFSLFKAGTKEAITFHQYCRFVGLAAPDKWQKIQGKLQQVEHVVRRATEIGEAGLDLRLHYRGKNESYSPEDLRTLRAALDYMERRFEPEMTQWEKNARRD